MGRVIAGVLVLSKQSQFGSPPEDVVTGLRPFVVAQIPILDFVEAVAEVLAKICQRCDALEQPLASGAVLARVAVDQVFLQEGIGAAQRLEKPIEAGLGHVAAGQRGVAVQGWFSTPSFGDRSASACSANCR